MYRDEIPKGIGIDIYGKEIGLMAETLTIGNTIMYASNKELVALDINQNPENLTTLNCWNNNLTHIEIPNKLEKLYCGKNNIRTLVLPESLITLYCQNNPLTELVLPKGIRLLRCDKELFNYDEYNHMFIDVIYPNTLYEGW